MDRDAVALICSVTCKDDKDDDGYLKDFSSFKA
jgi:hypothetical protein